MNGTAKEITNDRGADSRRLATGIGVLAVIAAGASWWAFGGLEKFAGFSSGLGFGIVLVGISRIFLRRQRTAKGAALVQSVMLGSLFSFVLLGGAVILVGILWKPAVLSFSLTVLPVYVGSKFTEVLSR